MTSRRALFALACLPFLACIEPLPASDPGTQIGSGSGTADQDDPFFDAATLATTTSYHHFAKINAKSYVSSVGTFDINLFAHGSTNDYAKIHPETTGSNVHMAVGTAIVREVLDEGGHVAKLTMMVKGPPGYDPSLGDWWFAVTDPDGNVLADAGGEPQVGRMTACHSCHIPRANDDFLFGVPKADQHH